MPKRSCPFGDSAPVQLKTRVRLRELSQGVMGERYRREIFGEGAGQGWRAKRAQPRSRENRTLVKRAGRAASGPLTKVCPLARVGLPPFPPPAHLRGGGVEGQAFSSHTPPTH